MQKVWVNSTVNLKLGDVDVESEWERLKDRIESQEASSPVVSFVRHHWMKVAAGLVILVVSLWLLNKNEISSGEGSTIFATQQSESSFYLPDSSQVWLASYSTLTVDEEFGAKTREVILKGEGKFEVEHDSLHPFFVFTENVIVKVVGTSFTVKVDSGVTVSVVEGKVKVYAKNRPDKFLMVQRGEKAYMKNERDAALEKIQTLPAPVERTSEDDNSPTKGEKSAKPSDVHVETDSEENLKRNELKEAAADDSRLEEEFRDPKSFLSLKSSWKKNQFSQSVVEGTLFNHASLTSYKNINLRITYTKQNGKVFTTFFTVYETIRPGEQLNFHKNLVDMFTNTKDLKVEIEDVEILSPNK
jgi:hypothetical protein